MNNHFGNTFSNISLRRWRQFESVDIDLHPRLTVLTGANGSGKTTILSILEGNLIGGSRDQYLATPVDEKSSTKSRFSISTLFSRFNPFSSKNESSENDPNQVGKIETSEGVITKISHPPPDKIQYQLQFSNEPTVTGFKIGSHRPAPKYQEIADIPVSGISPKAAFDFFRQSTSNYEIGQKLIRGNTQVTNPISPLKQTLIAFALQGSSNADVTAVPEVEGLFRDFQKTLRKVLPKEIRFRKLDVRPPEVVVVTDTGDFPIDGASGGLMSLIQVSWQIFLFTRAHEGKCVVLMDEPENHLHPSLQREFLSLLVHSFPEVQFIVVTHSPFIISSVRDSYVYALQYRGVPEENHSRESEKFAVRATRIDFSKNVGTASQILDEVLGVSVTIPVWAEERLIQIVDRLNKQTVDEASMSKLREDLEAEGLSDFLPAAISRLLK